MSVDLGSLRRGQSRTTAGRTLLLGGCGLALVGAAVACGSGASGGSQANTGAPPSSSNTGASSGPGSTATGSTSTAPSSTGSSTASSTGSSTGGSSTTTSSSTGSSTTTSSDASSDAATSISFPDGGPGCTPPATYPNLFVSVLGETQTAVQSKVTAAWTQLFHDPTNTNNVYYTGPGTGEAYIWDVADNEVRTEGMSYGMMIAVQLDHQTEFDALWTFVKDHMAQPNGQFAWHTTTAGALISGATGSAPDGDEYFATALIFAANRWGNTSGAFNYAMEAQAVLNTLESQEFDPNLHVVYFGPGITTITDGSYVLPAFYQVWACVDSVHPAFWQAAVPAARTFFHNAANATTGIVPDHSSLDGTPQGNFGSDAVRVVVNIMMDHNFFDADPWQTTWASTFAAFFNSQGANYVDAYTPSGTPVSGGSHSPHIVACNGTLGFGVSTSVGMPFVQALWNLPIPTGQFRYYDGMLYFLALLHDSGQFQLWY